MSPDRDALMGELERQVGEGSLRWLADDHGYAVWSAEWPRLELRALWTAVELDFTPASPGEGVALECRVGAVGRSAPTLEAGRAPVAEAGDVERACAEISTVLGGPLRAVVAGDLGELGLEGGQNLPHAGDGERPSGLEAALTDADRARLMHGLEDGLRRHAGWLWDAAGLEVRERSWPRLALGADHAGLWLTWYGARHGAPPPAVALTLVDPVEGELRAYELDDLLDTGGALDRPLEAEQPDHAFPDLAERLELIRPLLSGEAEAWRTLRRARGEAGASRALEDEVERSVAGADDAFRRGDHAAVVGLLEHLDGRLPRAAQMKLDLARRRLS